VTFKTSGFEKGSLFEQHFSTRTLAEIWNVSDDTVRRWFEDVPGVLKICQHGRASQRTELRIPRTIAEQVYKERTR
jgi:hypothetical protein